MSRRAVIYARISPATQTPVGELMANLRGAVAAREWELFGEETDAVQGLGDARPGLRRALKRLRGVGGLGDVLVTVSLAMVCRGAGDLSWLIQALRASRAGLVTSDGHLDTTTVSGALDWDAVARVVQPLHRAIRSEAARIAFIQASLRTKASWGRSVVVVNPTELASLTSRGLSPRRIARRLGVSLTTVRRRLADLKAAAGGEEEDQE